MLKLIIILAICSVVTGSHFRGAIIMWEPDSDSILIHFRISWRRSFSSSYNCTDVTIASGTLIGDSSMTCFSGCSDVVGSLEFYCTDFDTTEDWTTGINTVRFTPSVSAFSFGFSSCCWINGLEAGGGSWSFKASVDLTLRSDTGLINRSPTVEMAPIVVLLQGCSYDLYLPVGDVDGDIVRCRWANAADECSGVCNVFANAVLDETACTISYTASVNGYFAVALQIEDFASTVSTVPLSSIPLQFLVHVITCSDCTCESQPEFVDPTPDANDCFAINVGDQLNLTLKARSKWPLRSLTTISPIGMVRSNVEHTSDNDWNYLSVNVSWIPTQNESGRDHNLCYYATDNNLGLSNVIRCIKIPVSVKGPTPLRVERQGVSNTWAIIIDQTFDRPTNSAFITMYESENNTALVSIDVSTSSDVVYDPIHRRITVTFNYVFDIDAKYHVSIPSGLVKGYVSCGAVSQAINDSTFWPIELDCGDILLDNGHVDPENETAYPSTVTYMCDPGHFLVGDENRTCQSNRSWTGTNSSCQPKDCGIPLPLLNGAYTAHNGTTYLQKATFSCNNGYDFVGTSDRQCQVNGSWSSVHQFCMIRDCGPLISPQNGHVLVVNTTFGEIVTYTCEFGHALIGNNTRVCLGSGHWSDSEPTCVLKDCGDLPNPPHGSVYGPFTTYGAFAVYDCQRGFHIEGSRTRQCQANERWSSPVPTCILTDCGNLTSPINGDVLYTATLFDDCATYSCNVGYEVVGERRVCCQENATWTSMDTVCIIKDCGQVHSPENGNISLTTTVYSSSVYFTCDIGYDLNGSSEIVCLASGSWNATAPYCIIRECSRLESPFNGTVSLSNITYGSWASFKCDEGFDLLGNASVNCLANTSWSALSPTCHIKDCHDPIIPVNGTAAFTSTTYQSDCIFNCNIGFNMIGNNVSVCQSDGNWSSPDTYCLIKDCGYINPPDNGIAIGTSTVYQSVVTYRCNTGYDLIGNGSMQCQADGTWNDSQPFCKIKECEPLTVPFNGNVIYDNITYESTAQYFCGIGYDLIGPSIRDCLSNSSWSDDSPVCQIKDCSAPHEPYNGSVHYSSTTFNSSSAYDCDDGFTLIGGPVSTCNEFGNWSHPNIFCQIKDCGHLVSPNDEVIVYSSTVYQSRALYSCHTGYDLVGTNARTCDKNGVWTGQAPTCNIKDCGVLQPPVNGSVYQPSTTYNSYTLYVCDVGYHIEPEGRNNRLCQADGTWSSVDPTCELTDCGSPLAPEQGSVTFTSTLFNGTAVFECDRGYTLFGEKMIMCQDNEKWSSLEHNCTIKDCGNRFNPSNGHFTSTGTHYGAFGVFTCIDGYDLKGDSVINCLDNGTWNGTTPFCQIRDCGPLYNPDDGSVIFSNTVYGSQATFECNVGYEMVGSSQIVCLGNASWSESSPICKIKDCNPPSVPTNGSASFTTTTYQSVCVYSCDTGFDLIGDNTSICLQDGNWSSPYAHCQIKDCGLVLSPENGHAHVNTTYFESILQYSCNTGYDLIGAQSRECLYNGTWSTEDPLCTIRECGHLLHPVNGMVSYINMTYGAKAFYVCETGYDLIGDDKTECLSNGSWSQLPPVCSIKDCFDPHEPSNGTVTYFSTTYGSHSQYKCDDGFDLIGGSLSTCTAHGNWSDPAIFCQIKDCGHLVSPNNGNVAYEDTEFQSVAQYTCDTGYSLNGNNLRICNKDGIWTDSVPYCQIKDCGQLSDPSNGGVFQPSTTYGSYALYICNNGYHIEPKGMNYRMCQADGTWSFDPPACEWTDCGQPEIPGNGTVAFNSTSFNAVAEFMCKRGYTLIGEHFSVCQNDEKWSHSGQRCNINDCKELPKLVHGQFLRNGTTYESVGVFYCDDGYDLIGDDTVYCQDSGEWNGTTPVCSIKKCPVPGTINNGQVNFTAFEFMSVVKYECYPGYVLVGDSTRTCESSGNWSSPHPVCTIKDCGQPFIPTNGSVEYNTTTYGSKLLYVCDPGFDANFTGSSHCTETGTWSISNIHCLIKDCGPISPPTNGTVEISDTVYRSTGIFNCDLGYTLHGNNTAECLEDGQWNYGGPSCEIKDCGELNGIQNGFVTTFGTTFMSLANYSCDEGYDLNGYDVRVCFPNASWSHNDPQCVPTDCYVLPNPSNGVVIGASRQYGDIVTFQCDAGFDLVGYSWAKCLANKSWSNQTPDCVVKECGLPDEPKNGFVQVTSTVFGGRGTANCNVGYELLGNPEAECTHEGTWKYTVPECRIKECGVLPPLANGNVTLDGTEYGSLAYVDCDEGFEVIDPVLACGDNVNWNGSVGCNIKECGAISPPENGIVSYTGKTYGSKALFNCNDGFDMDGDAEMTCLADESWSSGSVICTIKDCGIRMNPFNGNVTYVNTTYGSTLRYACDEGYLLQGSVAQYCTNQGQWSDVPAICVLADCGLPNDILNGEVKYNETTFLSIATYTCENGFKIIGVPMISCFANETWSSLPICEQQHCEALEDPENGQVIATSTTYGSKAIYSCNPGYDLLGSRLVECIENEIWSDSTPICNLRDCGNLIDPVNGAVSLTNITVGSEVVYSCDEGFELTGEHKLVCLENGMWNSDPPLCNIKSCEEIDLFEFGNTLVSGLTYGSTVVYSCNIGYQLTGNSQRTCLHTGSWTGTTPSCHIKDCGRISRPKHGHVDVGASTYGSKAFFSCDNGYTLIGAVTAVCSADGRWDESQAECVINDCGLLKSPTNGSVLFSSTTFESKATFLCNEGFDMIGEDIIICTANKLWSGFVPECAIKDCGNISNPDNGTILYNGTTFLSPALFFCDDGFLLNGTNSMVCTANGTWNDSFPNCVIKDCGQLHDPEHGTVYLTGTFYLSDATFECEKGYQIVGEASAICGNLGLWQPESPVCQIRDCGQVEKLSNGNVIQTEGTTYGARVWFTCNDGYTLAGNDTMACQYTGEWNSKVPSCEKIESSAAVMGGVIGGIVGLVFVIVTVITAMVVVRKFFMSGNTGLNGLKGDTQRSYQQQRDFGSISSTKNPFHTLHRDSWLRPQYASGLEPNFFQSATRMSAGYGIQGPRMTN
ncbi:sushi, von Willebrand factor type A, EGF and pentraxin domain-containing protein 1-like isoform X2 [Mya arenaria]|uniref:sushi, von Willebrand factor type A, EGF and pentraxin domain-containing protein 1-like isoform X2 n=1 Tax=Mya arenaria TaxID=6604 RepID=UPI0022E70235|nr:sushi, von Willebrand factor type A, EGF and pentraxin domain-containing protein 1-like isoform X2 [Mya arenaria]